MIHERTERAAGPGDYEITTMLNGYRTSQHTIDNNPATSAHSHWPGRPALNVHPERPRHIHRPRQNPHDGKLITGPDPSGPGLDAFKHPLHGRQYDPTSRMGPRKPWGLTGLRLCRFRVEMTSEATIPRYLSSDRELGFHAK